MNGAESLARSLVASGVELCFATAGTSEMHFVAALDRVPGLRYAILRGELAAVGARPGPASTELFDLARPEIRWTRLAEGMGVEAVRVETLGAFADVFTSACARRGPFLIEFSI